MLLKRGNLGNKWKKSYLYLKGKSSGGSMGLVFTHRSEKKENKRRNKDSSETKKYCEVYKSPETCMVGTFGKNA
jgi:hypothetical protein